MRGVVFERPGAVRVTDLPEPAIEDPHDAIVEVSLSAVCGSDLHLFHARLPIEPGEPLPMRTLARKLCCDASNVTGIVDRLEERGLVRRDAAPGDRRVKMLVVTSNGLEVRRRIVRRLSEAPEPIARLSATDQRALREILNRAFEPGL